MQCLLSNRTNLLIKHISTFFICIAYNVEHKNSTGITHKITYVEQILKQKLWQRRK